MTRTDGLDVLLLHVDQNATTEILTFNSRGRFAAALHDSCSWLIALEYSEASERSKAEMSICTFSAFVFGPGGAAVAVGNLTVAWEPRVEIALSKFVVTVTGAYTVCVFVDGRPLSSLTIDVGPASLIGGSVPRLAPEG